MGGGGRCRQGTHTWSTPSLEEMGEGKKMCVGGGGVGSKSSRKSRRHRKQSGTRPLWASWGGWGTPLQDPLPAPTTTLRLQPPSEGRPLVSWEISKTGTPWNPCLTHHFHRFPQQVKESLDHLPLAETFFFFFPSYRTSPHPHHTQPGKDSSTPTQLQV